MSPAALGLDLALVAVLGGLFALERRAAFQLMLAQPLVSVPLLGVVLGDLQTGLWLGAILQLLWMSSAMFGANVPPNETVASMVIGGGLLLAGRHGPVPDVVACTAAILFGAPFAYIGRSIEVRLDHANLRLATRADHRPTQIGRLVNLGLIRAFGLYAAVIAIGAAGIACAVWFVAEFVAGAPRVALAAVGIYGIPALALAVALSGIGRRRGWVLAAGTFLLLEMAMRAGSV